MSTPHFSDEAILEYIFNPGINMCVWCVCEGVTENVCVLCMYVYCVCLCFWCVCGCLSVVVVCR